MEAVFKLKIDYLVNNRRCTDHIIFATIPYMAKKLFEFNAKEVHITLIKGG